MLTYVWTKRKKEKKSLSNPKPKNKHATEIWKYDQIPTSEQSSELKPELEHSWFVL